MTERNGRLIRFPQPGEGMLVDNDGDGYPDTSHDSPVDAVDVIDAELVPETGGELARREPITVQWRLLPSQAVELATHRHTRTAGRAVVRHGAYVVGGVGVVAKRAWDAKTNSRHERAMRSFEAKGDWDKVAEWEDRGEKAKDRRHRRRMDWLDAPGKIAKALVIACAGLIGVLFALGVVLAIANDDAHQLLGPITALFDLVRWVTIAVTIVWGPFLLAAPWVAVGVFWHIGRKAEAAPEWLMPARMRSSDGMPITPSIVVRALRDLGVTVLRNSIKSMPDAGAGMIGPIVIAGCGVEVDVSLPSGVATDEVQRRRRKLAENLNRHEHEVFITIPTAARTVRLWIADSGALDEPIGPSPLVTDSDITADLYTGRAPWGQDLRGDAAALALLQRHFLITGLSNQGKTAALRALVLWLALDISTEFRIADLKGVGDWRMFSGLATTLIQGPTDERVIAATEMLEEGVREMQDRIEALEESGATDGVTRDMARSGRGFHPVFLIVDEAQVAFMCPARDQDGFQYGGTKATSRYFMAARKIHNQGRAVNVVLWQGTQDPTDQNLPKLVREGAHIRASLVVGTEEQARMALGDKAVDGGAAPHRLRQGLDKGTLVVAGDGVPLPAGQASLTIRTHFIDGSAAVTIADRAKALRGPQAAPPDERPTRDLLEDLGEVLGDEPVRSADVPALLRELAPSWAPYKAMTGVQLRTRLEHKYGVKVASTGNRYPVDPAVIREALIRRAIEGDE